MSVSIKGRFRRSVNLERDFHAGRGLDGYVVTVKGRELLARFAESLGSGDRQRAWSIFGPYGAGKSAFALFAASLFRGNSSTHGLLREADETLAQAFSPLVESHYCPVLVVGTREPLNRALVRGLDDALQTFAATTVFSDGKIRDEVASIRDNIQNLELAALSDEIVFGLFRRAAAIVHRVSGGGLLIVVDELGKFLEYAALHPEESDLYVLQRLGEHASRSAGALDGRAPVFLLTILHQAFERYAARLSKAQQDEWRKIQGRFEDFGFFEPVDETLRLLAHSIERPTGPALDAEASSVVDAVLNHAALPPHFDLRSVREHLESAYPLHPAVALIVGPLFRRLAQNERSLFAFLASGEPYSLLDVLGGEGEKNSTYRLDHLYDYLINALGATLFYEGLNRLWTESQAALTRLDDPSLLSVRLLKQIAVLNYAGDFAGLKPTENVLVDTTGASTEEISEALTYLRESRVVSYRNFSKEYHIWQGSDFDLAARLREAREEIPLRVPLAEHLQMSLPAAPQTARRHSYRTGTNRVFEVLYTSEETWQSTIRKPSKAADGRILYVLPERAGERDTLIGRLTEAATDPLALFAIPAGVGVLRESIRELACLDWVRRNSPELEGDAAARMEVDHQRAELAAVIQSHLSTLLSTGSDGHDPCTWIHCGNVLRLRGERGLQAKLSAVCDDVFALAPEIWNELLNRRRPSSSAVRALKLLLQAMFENPEQEALGIDGTPAEYGLYASILKATGMHREADGGACAFFPPNNDRRGCVAVWDALDEAFAKAEGRPVSAQDLYDTLSAPPYSVRNGLIPVFLVAFYMHHEDEMAFYEEGVFVMEMTYEKIGRLLKRPADFQLQRVRIEGERAEILRHLAPFVGLPDTTDKPLPFVIRLLQRVRNLPPYARRTTALSDCAMGVRAVLFNAVEPTTLLFEDLPEACGIETFLTNSSKRENDSLEYSLRLQETLRELVGAYDELIQDIEKRIASAFLLRTASADDRRHELAARSSSLLPYVSELSLKSFLVRATDEVLDTREWYESIAALLAKKPPAQWIDGDLQSFASSLKEIARRFRNLEPLTFEVVKEGDGAADFVADAAPLHRFRVGVTSLNEPEREAVVNMRPTDMPKIDHLSAEMSAVLQRLTEDADSDFRLAVLGKLMSSLLSERDKELDMEAV